jgi:hypothetical protein
MRGRHVAAISCMLAYLVSGGLEPVRAESEPVRPPSALAIRAPGQLTLGADSQVDIEYTLPAALSGKLRVNVGRLAPPVQLGPGRYRATYTPPPEKYPQVAILALVLDDGSDVAWARIALLGSAQIAIQSEPSVDVKVRVDDATYGPFRTDSLGRASVPVVIPPGVTHATSIATDALGNTTEQTTPVAVPSFGRIVNACMPERADAFWVFAVDPRGMPLERAQFDLQAAPLRVLGNEPREPGVYRIRLEVPAGVHEGDRARLVASLSDEPARQSQCELRVPMARLEGVALSVDRPAVVATDTPVVKVTVSPRYVAGAEMQPVDIELNADFGNLSQTRIHTASPVEITWKLQQRFEAKTEALLTARSSSYSSQARVLLQPGPPAAIHLALASDDLRADGVSTAQLSARVDDAQDNPIADADFTASARGRVTAFEPEPSGGFHAEYRVPKDISPLEIIEVRDRKSGLVATLPVRLRPEQSDFYLGARGGYLSNFARVTAPLALIQAGFRLPFRALRLHIGIDAGFYASSYTDAASRLAIQTKLSAVPLLARADYVFDLASWELRAFVGPGVVFSHTHVQSLTSGTQEQSQAGLLLAAGGGISRVLGRGRIVLDLAYWYAPVSNRNVDGNAGGVNASLGYLAEL